MKKLVAFIVTIIIMSGIDFAQSNEAALQQIGTLNTSVITQHDGGLNVITGPSGGSNNIIDHFGNTNGPALQDAGSGTNTFRADQSLGSTLYNFIYTQQHGLIHNDFMATQQNAGSDRFRNNQTSGAASNFVDAVQVGSGGYNTAENTQTTEFNDNNFSLRQNNTGTNSHQNYALVYETAKYGNTVFVGQTGQDNGLYDASSLPGLVSGDPSYQSSTDGFNSLQVYQTGNGNNTGLHMEGFYDNRAFVTQTGDLNTSASYQISTGAGNILDVTQTTSGNSSSLLQTGAGSNIGVVYQH